jgi:hypothetical protein
MRKQGGELVRTQLAKWLRMLKEEYATDMVKPAKNGGPAPPSAGVLAPTKAEAKPAPKKSSPAKTTKSNPKFSDFTLADEFKCTAMDLFSAICTQEVRVPESLLLSTSFLHTRTVLVLALVVTLRRSLCHRVLDSPPLLVATRVSTNSGLLRSLQNKLVVSDVVLPSRA